MKNNKINICLFFIMFVLLTSLDIIAQSKIGTTIGQFLKIEPSSRSAAMGNAGAALNGEASLTFFNPAVLGRIPRSDVQFTNNQWLADISYNYAVGALKLEGIGSFMLQVTSLNSGEIDVRTVEFEHGTGEKYTVNNCALGVG